VQYSEKDLKVEVTFGDILDAPLLGSWDYICEKYGLNVWILNEGLADRKDKYEISIADARYIGIIKND
jgi:hypothetical protein